MQSSKSSEQEIPGVEVQLPILAPVPTGGASPAPTPESIAVIADDENLPGYDDVANMPPISVFDERPVFIAVMGLTGSGKTSFINAVSGSNLKVGHGLRSCTSKIGYSDPFEVNNRRVVLFDTPGFDDTSRADADILTEIALLFAELYQNGQQILGVVYLHPINSARMGGTAVRNVQMFREVLGNDAAKNVVILTTKWELAEADVGESREAELKDDPYFFKPLLDLDASIVRYPTLGDHDVALDIVKGMIQNNQPITLQIQREMIEAGLAVSETTAGQTLSRALAESLKEAEEKHHKQMKELETQQMRQHGNHLLDLQAEAERSYQQRVAEYERRQQAMQMNAHYAAGSELGRHIAAVVRSLLGLADSLTRVVTNRNVMREMGPQ